MNPTRQENNEILRWVHDQEELGHWGPCEEKEEVRANEGVKTTEGRESSWTGNLQFWIGHGSLKLGIQWFKIF